MHAGTIFVLFLAAGFLALVFYLHHLSQHEPIKNHNRRKHPSNRLSSARMKCGPANGPA